MLWPSATYQLLLVILSRVWILLFCAASVKKYATYMLLLCSKLILSRNFVILCCFCKKVCYIQGSPTNLILIWILYFCAAAVKKYTTYILLLLISSWAGILLLCAASVKKYATYTLPPRFETLDLGRQKAGQESRARDSYFLCKIGILISFDDTVQRICTTHFLCVSHARDCFICTWYDSTFD